MTGADRTWAARYNAGDVLLKQHRQQIPWNSRRAKLVTVQSVDVRNNILTVLLRVTRIVDYDPRRLKVVNVFRDVER